MVDTTKAIAAAQRLLAANGRSVTLVKYDTTPADSAEPWKGPTDPRASVDVSTTTDAVFVNPTDGKRLGLSARVDDLLKTIEQLAIVSLGAAVDPAQYDELQDGGVSYKIAFVEVLRPGDDYLLGFIGVQR